MDRPDNHASQQLRSNATIVIVGGIIGLLVMPPLGLALVVVGFVLYGWANLTEPIEVAIMQEAETGDEDKTGCAMLMGFIVLSFFFLAVLLMGMYGFIGSIT